MDRLAVRLMSSGAVLLVAVVLTLPYAIANAQGRSRPVSEGSGPLSELSTNVRTGSAPVHERGRSVRDGSAGVLGGNPVRGSVTGSVTSGPVSDVSVEPFTARQPVAGSGTVTDASVGAVKKDADSPIRALISQPVRELGPLQEQLRMIRPLPHDAAVLGDAPTQDEAANAPAPVLLEDFP